MDVQKQDDHHELTYSNEDTGCNPEDLPEAMNDREKWRERVRDIRAGGRHDDDDDESSLLSITTPEVPWKIILYSNLQSSFCLDVAQGRMNRTRIHSWRFASLAC